MKFPRKVILLAGLAAVYPAAVFAQADEQGQAESQQIAEQCMQDLQTFAQQMREDELWVTGWGTPWGYGAGPAPAQAPPDATGAAPADAAATPPPAVAGDPWATSGMASTGVNSPRYQISTLYSAAYVLAQKGAEDGCQYVLSELQNTYSDYSTRLQEAGVEPGTVTDWRQEQIVLAEPVQEVAAGGRLTLTIDRLTGTDVRTPRDERLGSVSDILLDPETGQVTYAIVARGGFLGIGEEFIAVPWDLFLATPGLNTLVLDVSESQIEGAPTIDPNTFDNAEQRVEQNEQIDQYWEGLNEG